MSLIEIVKLALRLNTTAFDGELTNIIESCKIDLALAGVNNIVETDPLIQRAVILYAKYNFGYNDNNEKIQAAYDMLKNALALSAKYVEPIVTGG